MHEKSSAAAATAEQLNLMIANVRCVAGILLTFVDALGRLAKGFPSQTFIVWGFFCNLLRQLNHLTEDVTNSLTINRW